MGVKRRDKIAETWFATVFPLDKFRVKEGVLVFEDLSAACEPGPVTVYLRRPAARIEVVGIDR